jgi:hypothetical protein
MWKSDFFTSTTKKLKTQNVNNNVLVMILASKIIVLEFLYDVL